MFEIIMNDSYHIKIGMVLPKDKQVMDRKYLVESINTGRQWRLDELGRFFQGRNRDFYRVFTLT